MATTPDSRPHEARSVLARGRDSLSSWFDRGNTVQPTLGLEPASVASLDHRAAQLEPEPRGAWFRRYRSRAIALDVAAALGAGLIVVVVPVGAAGWEVRLMVAAALPLLWLSMLFLSRAYARRFVGSTTEEYRCIARAVGFLAMLTAAASYGTKYELSRGIVVTVLPSLLVLALLSRRTLRSWLYRQRLAGREMQRTVVIGDVRAVGRMVRQIRRAHNEGLSVVAACVSGLDSPDDVPNMVEGVPVFGYPAEAMHAIDLFDAEVVAVSSDPDLSGPELRRLAWRLEERDVDLVVAAGLFEVAGPRLSIRPAAGMPMLYVERPVVSGFRRLVKAVADKALTFAAIVVAAPLLLVVAVAIRLDTGGPILFRQKRIGASGTEFEMYKFRTMVVDAEARLTQVQPVADAGNTVLFKMRSDPRVTRVGRVLRRFSLDELPQLINVMRGEMSLIGPRPPLPAEVEQYEDDAVRRLRVKPGLTGLWQVSGRSDLSWEESVRLDLWYVDNWSLVLDMQILGRTAAAVLRGRGAY
jgi:exopolysaccharide biosynthesis polyprenyl glycosylphosphotransferase